MGCNCSNKKKKNKKKQGSGDDSLDLQADAGQPVGVVAKDNNDNNNKLTRSREGRILMMNAQSLNSFGLFFSKLINGKKRRQLVKIHTIEANDSSNSQRDEDILENDENHLQLHFLKRKKQSVELLMPSSEIPFIEVPDKKVQKRNNLSFESRAKRSVTAPEAMSDTKSELAQAATATRPNSAQSVETGSQVSASTSITRISSTTNEDAPTLFTSIQQLCYEVINRKLLANNKPPKSASGKVLCLFVFGCQGSSKGEIAYDLVQHSPLHKALSSSITYKLPLNEESSACCCPLYHHIDVAAIIVANIDTRILEYSKLLAQTLRYRNEQLALCRETVPPDNRGDSKNTETRDNSMSYEDDDDNSSSLGFELQLSNEDIDDYLDNEETRSNNKLLDDSENNNLPASVTATTLPSLIKHHSSQPDDFGQITLSTKQRSILQLKLLKYYNSVTSKWILNLIKCEIDKLELMFKRKIATSDKCHNQLLPDRVYLINLVPNQLSLFKSCLYLRQSLNLKNRFDFPYYAIRFERRTNIKLLNIKEKTLLLKQQEKAAQASQQDTNKTRGNIHLRIGLGNLRLPINFRSSIESDRENSPGTSSKLGSLATNLLSSSNDVSGAGNGSGGGGAKDNEKLGPKYNENFAQQFKAMDKLITMRYNPKKDYNYALLDDENDSESSAENETENLNQTRSASLPNEQNMIGSRASPFKLNYSCCSQLEDDHRHRADQNSETPGASGARLMLPSDRQMSSSMQNLRIAPSPDAATTSALNQQHLEVNSRHLSITPVSQASACSSNNSNADYNWDSPESSVYSRRSSRSGLDFPPASPLNHPTTTTTTTTRKVKRALELELFDSSMSAVDDTSDQSISKLALPIGFQGPASEHKPAKQAHHSLYPFASNKSSHKQSTGKSNPNHYKLVAVRVAYANEQSQIVYEAKKTHPRLIKLKSKSDLEKLMRVYEKSQWQMCEDCDWLLGMVAKYNQQQMLQHQQQQQLAGANHRKRHSISSANHDESAAAQQVAMIVFTIKIDVSLLRSNQFHFPKEFLVYRLKLDQSRKASSQQVTKREDNALESAKSVKQQPVPILFLTSHEQQGDSGVDENSHKGLVRPASGQSSSFGGLTGAKPKRHVQFKLNQAPNGKLSGAGANNSLLYLKVQHRQWIRDDLFLSATDETAIELIELMTDMMNWSLWKVYEENKDE